MTHAQSFHQQKFNRNSVAKHPCLPTALLNQSNSGDAIFSTQRFTGKAQWVRKMKWELGGYSTVTLTTTDQWSCTTMCFEHAECHGRCGSAFLFFGARGPRGWLVQALGAEPHASQDKSCAALNADETIVEDRRAASFLRLELQRLWKIWPGMLFSSNVLRKIMASIYA